ncbi:aminoglycoside 3'-phosphotransferase [Pseudoclavibacter chungangensis]|uniref:Aminoglycoside 3'-phosphotransferase n=1 Tax=Pseudoclavibacter chungangensis TaxID=587635 RepID=A0A7J5C0E0_9MICO|nr:aminoglycoside 3'-phosphotransferase [Pseudoclavibacter chungangensis]KAB1659624.1 aminoglycoside 3'-phosphotransferase [Pseudoclavibacter chungangensis]NYJ67456.1 kanamycin kinase [Pseudoclavibacter chungangensis]
MDHLPAPSDPAQAPPPDTPVPCAVVTTLDRLGLVAPVTRPVWRNSVGGLTFAITDGDAPAAAQFYVKWNPRTTGESLADEAERLRWIRDRHPAPVVVELIADEHEEILVTRALPGSSAVAERWVADPDTALRALGEGLRRLHDMPVEGCPFEWSVARRLEADGIPADAVGPAPDIDRLVVCQGDPCAPNTLLDDHGSFLAHVDLARLGIADRWADLAVMSMSLEWNYPERDERIFWDAYGVEPDVRRIDYYRRLWDAT